MQHGWSDVSLEHEGSQIKQQGRFHEETYEMVTSSKAIADVLRGEMEA